MARPKKTTAKKTTTRGRKGTPATKRPPNNTDVPKTIIEMLNHDFGAIKEMLDNFAQHLRALDRMRLNGVGIKKMGFIDRAYELALENGEFLPHYLTLDKFGKDIQYFMDFRSLTDLVTQIREQLWNITIQSADIAYTDALEFYSSVREAPRVAANKSIMQMANMPSAKVKFYTPSRRRRNAARRIVNIFQTPQRRNRRTDRKESVTRLQSP